MPVTRTDIVKNPISGNYETLKTGKVVTELLPHHVLVPTPDNLAEYRAAVRKARIARRERKIPRVPVAEGPAPIRRAEGRIPVRLPVREDPYAEYEGFDEMFREVPGEGGPRKYPRIKNVGKGGRDKFTYHQNKARKGAASNEQGPKDIKTAKMLYKLSVRHPERYEQFKEHASNLNSRYFRYRPSRHVIELYTHRQQYLGSFTLPVDLRHKSSVIVHPEPYLNYRKNRNLL